MSFRRGVSFPEKEHRQIKDLRPARMKLKHSENEGYTLHAQDSRDLTWKKFADYNSFLSWLSIYRGNVIEKSEQHTIFEMPNIVSVFNIPRKFFNGITEPGDLVWIMRRVHPDYIAQLDRFSLTHGLTNIMGRSIICKRLFLYKKQYRVPYCVILVVHDYIETQSRIKYI